MGHILKRQSRCKKSIINIQQEYLKQVMIINGRKYWKSINKTSWAISARHFVTSKLLGGIIQISSCRLYHTSIVDQSEQYNVFILLRYQETQVVYIQSYRVLFILTFQWLKSWYPNVLRNPLSGPSVYSDTISPMWRTLVVEFISTV